MFQGFYGLNGMPFQLTPDARFFFAAKGHSRAAAHLTYGLAQGEGFVVITGEVGAGKTTLVERLVAQLDPGRFLVSRVSTTQVSGDDLLRLAMAGFGLEEPGTGKPEMGKPGLLRRFGALLDEARQANRRCLLIVDEVQNLSPAALEELRMLSNLAAGPGAAEPGAAGPGAVLQTVLVGQPQFREVLARPDLEQLRQRVLTSFHLGPMTAAETRAYVEHRLRTVGWDGRPHWQDGAFAAVFAHTDGIPRRINRLCSRVLLYGALEALDTVDEAAVAVTAQELTEDLRSGGSGGSAEADLPPVRPDLPARVAALEATVARREQVFQRLGTLLGAAP